MPCTLEKAKRVEPHPTLRADDGRPLQLIEHDRPGLDDIHGQPILQPDEPQAQLLDIVAARRTPRRVHVHFLVGLARNTEHLRVAQQVKHARDVIDAHVIERPAARDLFLHEIGAAIAVDKRPSAPPKAGRPPVIDFAQVAIVDQVLGRLGLLAEQGVELDRQLAPQLLRPLVHRLGVGVRASHRLFAVDVLARLQRGDGHRHVKVVVQAHVDRHNIVARQQLAIVGVGIGDAKQPRDALHLCRVNVGDRHYLAALDLRIALQVALADLAYPDHADPYLVCHVLLLYIVMYSNLLKVHERFVRHLRKVV